MFGTPKYHISNDPTWKTTVKRRLTDPVRVYEHMWDVTKGTYAIIKAGDPERNPIYFTAKPEVQDAWTITNLLNEAERLHNTNEKPNTSVPLLKPQHLKES